MSLVERDVLERVQRLLALPAELEALERQRTALRAERRTTEVKLTRQRTIVLGELLDDERYRAAKAERERAILTDLALHNDDDWSGLSERVDQLTTTIERVEAEIRVLDHERKALKAALEREYASVIEQILSDKFLADAVAAQRLKGANA